MLNIYQNSKVYDLNSEIPESILHKEVVDVELLILIHLEVPLENELKEMLDKMTSALKLSQDNVEYLLFKESLNLSHYVNKYKTKNVLIFGGELEDLAIYLDLASYHVHSLNNFNFLRVNSILDIYSNQNLKSKLWGLLQQMFK